MIPYFQQKKKGKNQKLRKLLRYASTDYVYTFTIEYGGQDKDTILFDPVFKNEITKVEISKKDITNDEEIAGA
ncbi:MAG: hypothetical protein ACI4UK_00360 [Floccifex sp.]